MMTIGAMRGVEGSINAYIIQLPMNSCIHI